MNRFAKTAMAALLLLLLPVLSLADAPVLLVDLPETAQMVEDVGFDNGDFIQTYQLEGGVTVQLLRYSGFTMTMDELIASDWPVNSGVEMHEMAEISGYPAQHAHIWQLLDKDGYPVKAQSGELKDGEKMMEIDLILVSADGATLIYQDTYLSGQRGDSTIAIIESLQVQGAQEAEVG